MPQIIQTFCRLSWMLHFQVCCRFYYIWIHVYGTRGTPIHCGKGKALIRKTCLFKLFQKPYYVSLWRKGINICTNQYNIKCFRESKQLKKNSNKLPFYIRNTNSINTTSIEKNTFDENTIVIGNIFLFF